MSDDTLTDAGTPVAAVGGEMQAAPMSFGAALAQAREALGLSVGDIAARLRIHARQVNAIERGDLAALPAIPYVRGFIRNYAKEVQIDATPLIESFNRSLEPASEQVFEGVVPLVPAGGQSRVSRAVVIIGAVVALLAFALIGWYATRDRAGADGPVAAPPAVAPSSTLPPPSPLAAAAPDDAKMAASADVNVKPVFEAAAGVVGGDAAENQNQAVLPPGQVALKFRFRGNSWIEVRQEDGAIVYSRLNLAGSEQTVTGKPPLTLLIGNASAVDLDYRDKRVDLKSSISTNNVARFTLK
jgi:cytoskeleton protein RodZ